MGRPGLYVLGGKEMTMDELCTKGAAELAAMIRSGAVRASDVVDAHLARIDEVNVVLAPVCCERPWVVGDDIERVGEIAGAMRMILPVNVLGLPACAVPVDDDDGLPQGVQRVGARFREDLLLDAAQAIEDRSPRRTPIEPRVAAQV
jgi:amidase